MEQKYKKLGKNTILVMVGQAGSSLISLLMLPLYTSWLTTEEYGTVDLMSTYASIILSIITCCVADSIFIFPKNADDESKKKYFSSGLLFVLVAFLVSSLINVIANRFIHSYEFLNLYSWHTLFLTLSMFLQKYAQQFTRSLEKMVVFATTGIVHTIAVALLAILLIPIYKLDGYIYSLILSNIIAAIYSLLCSRSYKYISLRAFSKPHLKTLLIYGVPLIPNSLMWWMVNGLNRPVMEAYLGMSAIGLYAVANKFPGIVSMITNVFSNAWGISMLDEFEKPGFNTFFNRMFRLITFVSVISAFFLIIFSKQVISIFASDSFYEAWHVLPMLIISTVINTSTGLMGGIFMAMKQSKFFFYSSMASAATSVAFTFLLINQFGLLGCAIAAALSFLVAFGLRVLFARNHIKGFSLLHFIVMLLALLATNIILESDLSFAIKAILYLLIYIFLTYINRDSIIPIKNIIQSKWKKS
ncbi:MAG: oligosaccharide flippase family protein [Prevotella sp.]|nr:oligosaccharide flippase family protein [Prevotella sp.]